MAHQNSSIEVNTIEPQSGTTLTIGNSGQDVVVNADSIKNNVLKDAGGNALFTSNGSGVLSGVNAGFGSAQVLLSTTTVSTAVTNISFTSGIDSTYKEYVFEFISMNPTVEDALAFQCSTDGGSNYNTILTSTWFWAYHTEAAASSLAYRTDMDKAQATTFQGLIGNTTAGSDYAASGELHLFNPASTTYVKNWYSRVTSYGNTSWAMDCYSAGYFNTTTAINAIRFTYSSGNIQAGKIKMYGIK